MNRNQIQKIGVKAIHSEDPEGKPILVRVGRSVITEDGIEPLGGSYPIPKIDVSRDDWLAQLMEKDWFYDPTDFLDVLERAHKHLVPGSTPKQQQELTQRRVEICLQRSIQPFYPSRILKKHTYLVNRMNTIERAAFIQYLVDSGFGARKF